MKTLVQSLFFFGFACLMNACSSPQSEDTRGLKTIHIEPDNIRDDVMLSEFAEAKLVPLPTADDLIIGKIRRIRTSDKYICLSDWNAIYRFSRSGEFLGKIEKKGQGPDEYTSIMDFIITGDDEIAVLTEGRRILFYSWDGKMTKEVKLDPSLNSALMTQLGDKLLMNIGNFTRSKHVLPVFDIHTGKKTNDLLPVDEYKAKYLYCFEANNFTPGQNDTTCYFFTWYNDTIYRVTPNTCQPAVFLDFDGRNIPASYYQQDFPDILKFYNSLPTGKPSGTFFFLQSDNYQMVQYARHRDWGGTAVISLKDDHIINMEKLHIDELEGFPVEMYQYGAHVNHFPTSMDEAIFVLQPFDILEYVEEHAPESMDDIKKKIQYTSDDQNPVLLVMKLK